jgi:tRNA/rRNA methyltransferase
MYGLKPAPSPYYNQFLLTGDQRDRLDVVLVSPRNPLNIGAAARAMANFGFARLAVAAPFEAHWREAQAAAVGADDLLQDAKRTESLAEAVADCTLVVGTGTLTYRKPEQRVVRLPDLAPLVRRELERGGRVAVVFGPEKHGLTREDLSFCHLLVEIPTDARQPSMNLGQAVAVCLYELACRAGLPEASRASDKNFRIEEESAEKHPSGAKGRLDSNDPMYGLKPAPFTQTSISGGSAAPSGRLELLAGVVEESMTAAGYSPLSMRAANRHDLRLLLRRLAPTERETRRILGIFRRILWRLKRVPKDSSGSV